MNMSERAAAMTRQKSIPWMAESSLHLFLFLLVFLGGRFAGFVDWTGLYLVDCADC